MQSCSKLFRDSLSYAHYYSAQGNLGHDLKEGHVRKMQLQLVYNKDGDQELMLIELHGSIENTNEGNMDGHLMGHLQWLSEKDALLVIGSSIIRGKVSELEMPMLLTRSLMKNTDDDDGELEVPHIVTKKIVFRTKPFDFVENILPKLLPDQENIETQHLEH